MLHDVIQVKPTQDFKVYVYFSDWKIKLFDVSHLLNTGVFKKISDLNIFINRCTVMNGTLAWDIAGNFDVYNCIDIDPESIYDNGIEVPDPLEKSTA